MDIFKIWEWEIKIKKQKIEDRVWGDFPIKNDQLIFNFSNKLLLYIKFPEGL